MIVKKGKGFLYDEIDDVVNVVDYENPQNSYVITSDQRTAFNKIMSFAKKGDFVYLPSLKLMGNFKIQFIKFCINENIFLVIDGINDDNKKAITIEQNKAELAALINQLNPKG